MVFIVFEGIDASGKSTQASNLIDHLRSQGMSVHARFHPSGDNEYGVMARRFLLSKGGRAHFAAAMCYILDIIRSVVICPWWLHDHFVFVRYLMGTAYLPHPLDRFAYHFFKAILPQPEYTFYLDVDPEEAYRRIMENRSEIEMFETPGELRRIAEKTLIMARYNGWNIVDANRPEEEIEGAIWAVLHPS